MLLIVLDVLLQSPSYKIEMLMIQFRTSNVVPDPPPAAALLSRITAEGSAQSGETYVRMKVVLPKPIVISLFVTK